MSRNCSRFVTIAMLLGRLLLARGDGLAQGAGGLDRWWPVQAAPKTIVRLDRASFPLQTGSYDMLAQSVAGLAAKAVNEGRSAELVWLDSVGGMYHEWLARRLAREPQLETRAARDVWELVDAYKGQGLIKGYILYRADRSDGELNEHRPGMDCSVNVATSLAGVLEGVIVDESLEAEAKAHGLVQLADVRNRSQQWCFENYRDRFSRRLICTQDPRKSHTRDLAIARQAFTVYGHETPTREAMQRLEPLSPVLGWNGGDEFKTTEMSSRLGHIQTATDWCHNLPVLMAFAADAQQATIPAFDPNAIDWQDRRSGVSFLSTDGDNVQWLLGNFFQPGEAASYWGSPARGRIPFGWSHCFTQLAQLCPEAIAYAVETRRDQDSFVEWGGGYYYPDLFGADRPDRWELLAEQARRTWRLMRTSGSQMIGFNCANYASSDARRAYEVIAAQTDGLLAILIFQYAPYEAGAGEVFWVRDSKGVEVPVITARYSIWEHSNGRPRAGTPAKIAREIRESAPSAAADAPRYDWVMAHVWSYFREAPGDDEDAENMVQDQAAATGGVRGYLPAAWCAQRLPESIRVVSPEEMAWRIRMDHDPAATKRLINSWHGASEERRPDAH